jgi:hypothetical protein
VGFDLSTLTRRPIAATDAAALGELLNVIEVVDVFGEYYSKEDAADQINAPLLDLDRGTVGVIDDDLMVTSFWPNRVVSRADVPGPPRPAAPVSVRRRPARTAGPSRWSGYPVGSRR